MWAVIPCILTLLFSSPATSFANSNPNINSRSSPKISSSNTDSGTEVDSSDSLLSQAKAYLSQRDPDKAFGCLVQLYSLDPNAPGLQGGFESFFRLRIDMATTSDNGKDESDLDENDMQSLIQDRFGLASLLIDQERHEEASTQLRVILSYNNSHNHLQRDKAISMLYRTQASACQWQHMQQDAPHLISSVRNSLKEHETFYQQNLGEAMENLPNLPPLHPFDALKWPCIGVKDATDIAACYANRAMANVARSPSSMPDITKHLKTPLIKAFSSRSCNVFPNRKIKIGYISPDFTSKHPLAFLMQNIFKLHNQADFETHLYSFSQPTGDTLNEAPEIAAIKSGANHWTCTQNPSEMMQAIQDHELDVLIDLCGYAGTSSIAEIMAKRLAPIQISYMGFPGSSGAPFMDYVLVDNTVIPPLSSTSVSKFDTQNDSYSLRPLYTESLIYMPHCYFVNCHKAIMKPLLLQNSTEIEQMKNKYSLPQNAFIFCCHSRPDKIDPQTFRTWMRALKQIRNASEQQKSEETAVLWLLRSGEEMEKNLRAIAKTEFQLEEDALIFCDVAPRNEHLKRLGVADLFLDTPAYNAHTLGCDCLYAGVPMISLLRPEEDEYKIRQEKKKRGGDEDIEIMVDVGDGDTISTEKWVSRVGASLLKAAGLDELIVDNLKEYEDLMVKCAKDSTWFQNKRESLIANRDECPLFDTERWVRNWEVGLREVVQLYNKECSFQQADILIVDDENEKQ